MFPYRKERISARRLEFTQKIFLEALVMRIPSPFDTRRLLAAIPARSPLDDDSYCTSCSGLSGFLGWVFIHEHSAMDAERPKSASESP